MSTASTDYDAFDGGGTGAAGLAGARVDAVVQLEESRDSFSVDVVGYGRAAELYGVLQDFDKGCAKPGELVSGKASCLAAGADSGMKQRLVGVDVADAMKQLLVEQRGLDGRLAIAEECDEVFERDGERLTAWAGIGVRRDGQAAESACVDEADLFAATERKDGMRVEWNFGFGRRDEKAAGHA